MGYISSETVKAMRTELKKKFPNLKLSVTGRHHSEIVVAIMEGSVDFGTEHEQINHYYYENRFKENPEALEVVKGILEVVTKGQVYDDNHYGDYGSQPNFYVSVHVGKWDKYYTKKAA